MPCRSGCTLPEQVSTYAASIDDMFHLIMWITGIIFVIVEGILLFFLFKYRHREGRQAHYTHGNNRVEVVWTIVPALICVVLALLSRHLWEDIKEHMPHDAVEIHVTGRAVRLELPLRRVPTASSTRRTTS